MSSVNPSSMMALAVSFLNVCTVLLALRLLSRRMQKMRIGVDDIMISIAWLLTIVLCVNMISAVAYQLWGRTLPPRRDAKGKISAANGWSGPIAMSEEFAYIQEAIFPVQLMFCKLSLLFFYRRMFCIGSRNFMHWATMAMIGVTTLWGVVMFFIFVFQCGTRFSLVWDGPLKQAHDHCLNASFEIGMGVTDVLLDLVILILPVRSIVKLQMRVQKKLLVIALFSVGAITIAASVVRLSIYTSLMLGVRNSFTLLDENMTVSTEMYWGLFEAGFAVTTACLPSVQVLLTKAAVDIGSRIESYNWSRNMSIVGAAVSRKRSYVDIERQESGSGAGSHGGSHAQQSRKASEASQMSQMSYAPHAPAGRQMSLASQGSRPSLHSHKRSASPALRPAYVP